MNDATDSAVGLGWSEYADKYMQKIVEIKILLLNYMCLKLSSQQLA
jgi:hypothetical protein